MIDRVPNAKAAMIWRDSRSLFHSTDLKIELNSPIQKHESLSRLILSIESDAGDLSNEEVVENGARLEIINSISSCLQFSFLFIKNKSFK